MSTVLPPIEVAEPANFTCSALCPFRCDHFAAGLGLGNFGPAAYPGCAHGADSVRPIPTPGRFPAIEPDEGLSPGRRAVAVGFLGIAYFADHPERHGSVSDNGRAIFLELVENPPSIHWVARGGFFFGRSLLAVMSTSVPSVRQIQRPYAGISTRPPRKAVRLHQV